MTIDDLFKSLSYGELQNLAIGGDGSGIISIEHHPRLINITNQGLKALYTRFNLQENELIIDSQDDTTLYYLQVEHALSNGDMSFEKYIRDTVEAPFEEDVIRVLRVYTEDGEELPINDPTQETSVYLPQHDCLQIPFPVTGNAYFVIYQAKHPKLTTDGGISQEIELPLALEPALEAFVASRIYTSMNGQEHVAKGHSLFALYQMICDEVRAEDLAGTSQTQLQQRFELRGWC